MGSSLSPDNANFFMEDFVEAAISRMAYKPTCWSNYMDDMFMI